MKIEIDRDGVEKYWSILYLLAGLAAYIVGVLFSILLIWKRIPARQSEELEYWIEDECIRINQGLFFKKQKSIPFSKITDVMWHQGPIMRWVGVEGLRIQTAGTQYAEGTMIGVINAQQVRNEIMTLLKKSSAV